MRFNWTIENVTGIEQGREIGDGWRILGDANIELVLGPAGANQFAGSTKCVKVTVRLAPSAGVAILYAYVSIQHDHHTSIVRHVPFFIGGPFRWDDLEAGRLAIPNKCGEQPNNGVGRGGLCYLERLPGGGVAETESERRAVCQTCPDDMFTGEACQGLKCCRQKVPDPKRWLSAIQIGHCPRGHFGGELGPTLQAPILPGLINIGGVQMATA